MIWGYFPWQNPDDVACAECQKINRQPGWIYDRFILLKGVNFTYIVVASDHGDKVDLNDSETREQIAAAIRRGVMTDEVAVDDPVIYASIDHTILPTEWWLDYLNGKSHFGANFSAGFLSTYANMPEEMAGELTNAVQEAVQWFHPKTCPDFRFDAVPVSRSISDEEVEERIQGFQYAMDKEISRIIGFLYSEHFWRWGQAADWRARHKSWIEAYQERMKSNEVFRQRMYNEAICRYDLSRLPYEVQRALVTRWQAIWDKWDGKYHPRLGFLPGWENRYILYEIETASSPKDTSLIVRFYLANKEA